MLQRSLYLLLSLLVISFSASQTISTPETAKPTFKANAQLVVVDVAVADRNGQPVAGLRQENFEVFENGERQTVASFEEHRGGPAAVVAKTPPLPPHFYSNAPVVEPSGAINILLLDALNTEFGDQASVRGQMIQYLQTIDPGPRLAIFTLSSRLRMVEGFTADPKQLLEALKHKHWGGTPQTSAMLRTQAEDAVGNRVLALMSEGNGTGLAIEPSGTGAAPQRTAVDPGASAESIAMLQRFQEEIKATQSVSRIYLTLDALRKLSRYLEGFHGRKNLIWFSGSFPYIDFPAPGERSATERSPTEFNDQNALQNYMRETINLLASAQVVIYPIAAQGLTTQSMYEAQTPKRPMSSDRGKQPLEKVITGANAALREESLGRSLTQTAALDLADNTGGQAFVNSNGLRDAMAEILQKGSYYYRLSYAPTDKRTLGRYRNIVVNFRKGPSTPSCTLAYRRGYFEQREKDLKSIPVERTDLLQPLLSRGLPDSTEIIYTQRVLRSAVQPAPGTAILGDNKDLQGPVSRVGADFLISSDRLDFNTDPEGARHGRLEFALVVYDHEGTPLNWIVRSARTTLKPGVDSASQRIQFHQEIDIPKGDSLFLRSGVYDLQSNKAGTLEIPVSMITAPEAVPVEAQKSVATAPASLPASESASQAPANPSSDSHPEKVYSTVAAATIPPTVHDGQPSSSSAHKDLQAVNESYPADIPGYCAVLSGKVEHSAALGNLCEFVLSMRKRLPNIICNREMKRNWTDYSRFKGAHFGEKKSDVVTAQVSYRDGQEYYDNVRLDGQPVATESPLLPPSSLPGAWSVGEFSTILAGAFLPSAKAEFRFEKETKLGSTRALIFTVHVEESNNRSYLLFADDKTWFPEYRGQLWIDQSSFQLLRLRRETAYMRHYPIRQVKTTIDYANVPLGDGTNAILPVHSEVMTCAPPPVGSNSNDCSRSAVQFTNWQKFRATTSIVASPAE
jgi:VWFA-related protein